MISQVRMLGQIAGLIFSQQGLIGVKHVHMESQGAGACALLSMQVCALCTLSDNTNQSSYLNRCCYILVHYMTNSVILMKHVRNPCLMQHVRFIITLLIMKSLKVPCIFGLISFSIMTTFVETPQESLSSVQSMK